MNKSREKLHIQRYCQEKVDSSGAITERNVTFRGESKKGNSSLMLCSSVDIGSSSFIGTGQILLVW